MISLEPTLSRILYFFYQTDCSACATALPDVEKFSEEQSRVMVVPLNIHRFNWSVVGYSPPGTPTYVMAVNRQPVNVWELAGMSLEQLRLFCEGVLNQEEEAQAALAPPPVDVIPPSEEIEDENQVIEDPVTEDHVNKRKKRHK